MLGDYTDTSYSTAEQSKREFIDLTIMPVIAQWEAEFNLKRLTLGERRQGYAFRSDLRAMMRADTVSYTHLALGYAIDKEVAVKFGEWEGICASCASVVQNAWMQVVSSFKRWSMIMAVLNASLSALWWLRQKPKWSQMEDSERCSKP